MTKYKFQIKCLPTQPCPKKEPLKYSIKIITKKSPKIIDFPANRSKFQPKYQ